MEIASSIICIMPYQYSQRKAETTLQILAYILETQITND